MERLKHPVFLDKIILTNQSFLKTYVSCDNSSNSRVGYFPKKKFFIQSKISIELQLLQWTRPYLQRIKMARSRAKLWYQKTLPAKMLKATTPSAAGKD